MVARSAYFACRLVLKGARIDAGKSHGLMIILNSNEAYSLTRNCQKQARGKLMYASDIRYSLSSARRRWHRKQQAF